MPSELKRFLLIYSSQTGQAKAIAEEVAEKAPDHGFQADVHCISQTEKRFWLEREKLAVIITSTTGDGDPPDTANKFWRRLKKKTLDRNHLSHLRFSLLGLGDSNYSNFCNCGKNFHRRFLELGAAPILSGRFADDAVGLEQEVEPWMEDLFPALRKELYGDPETVAATNNCVSADRLRNEEVKAPDRDSTERSTHSEVSDLSGQNVSELGDSVTNGVSELSPNPERTNESSVTSENPALDVPDSGSLTGSGSMKVAGEAQSAGDRTVGESVLTAQADGGICIPIQGQPDQPTQDKPDQPTQDKLDQPTQDKLDQPTHDKLDQPTHDKPDPPTHDKPDQPTQDKLDQPTHDKPDHPTQDKPDQPTQDKPDQPTHDKLDQSTHDKPDQPTHDKPDQPTHNKPDQPTHDKPDQPTQDKPDQPTHDKALQAGVHQPTECGDGPCPKESLSQSVPPLSESSLTLPVLPAQYLKLTFTPDAALGDSRPELQNGCPFPSAKTDVVSATILQAECLTRHDAVKKTLKLSLQLPEETSWDWSPGDSFGLVCPNPAEEVTALLNRLGADPDTPYRLEVLAGTKKRAAAVPPHIPVTSTLRQVFTHCCDIRSPPKKALLRSLVSYCETSSETRRLQELCSKQGAESYTALLRQPAVSVLDVLRAFPSCAPPVERLLEHLPRLQPRPYSAASCPDSITGRQVDFVFNVIDIPAGEGRCGARQGVCTGFLDKVTRDLQTRRGQGQTEEGYLTQHVEQLSLRDLPQIPVYLRSSQHFRPPTSLRQSLIMIGPGTGVAPFVGFLQHRERALSDLEGRDDVGESWLFFGCRHKDRDFLFREELERQQRLGVLNQLLVSFSRDAGDVTTPRYVQDMLRHHADEVMSLVVDRDAVVYVCGDAQGMARDVNKTFVDLLQTHRGFSEKAAADFMKQMRLSQRYKEDVWT